jgi:branched-chain amino acid transport system substrate-binding protein
MIKIGALSILSGPYKVLGDDAIRGWTLALDEYGHQVAGQSIQLIIEGTNGIEASASQACHTLVNEIGVDVVIGPLSGDEARGVRSFARQHPDHVFLNGVAGSQQIYDPTPNFFSFTPNGVQYIAGLGTYCYEQGYRRIVTLSEGYSYTFAQIGGFALEFCKAGGEIAKMLWCGLGTSDFSEYIQQFPDDIDAICVVLGGDDSARFIQQYSELDRSTPMIGGTLQSDPTTLHFVQEHADLLSGMISASPICDDATDDNWRSYVQAYNQKYADDGLYSPSLIAYGYYTNMKALLLALSIIDGDLSNGQKRLKDTLVDLELDGLFCELRLDRHNFAITDNFITEISVDSNGQLYTKMIKRIEKVDSTLGYSDEDWLALGEFGIRNMPCGIPRMPTFQEIIEQRKKGK